MSQQQPHHLRQTTASHLKQIKRITKFPEKELNQYFTLDSIGKAITDQKLAEFPRQSNHQKQADQNERTNSSQKQQTSDQIQNEEYKQRQQRLGYRHELISNEVFQDLSNFQIQKLSHFIDIDDCNEMNLHESPEQQIDECLNLFEIKKVQRPNQFCDESDKDEEDIKSSFNAADFVQKRNQEQRTAQQSYSLGVSSIQEQTSHHIQNQQYLQNHNFTIETDSNTSTEKKQKVQARARPAIVPPLILNQSNLQLKVQPKRLNRQKTRSQSAISSDPKNKLEVKQKFSQTLKLGHQIKKQVGEQQRHIKIYPKSTQKLYATATTLSLVQQRQQIMVNSTLSKANNMLAKRDRSTRSHSVTQTVLTSAMKIQKDKQAKNINKKLYERSNSSQMFGQGQNAKNDFLKEKDLERQSLIVSISSLKQQLCQTQKAASIQKQSQLCLMSAIEQMLKQDIIRSEKRQLFKLKETKLLVQGLEQDMQDLCECRQILAAEIEQNQTCHDELHGVVTQLKKNIHQALKERERVAQLCAQSQKVRQNIKNVYKTAKEDNEKRQYEFKHALLRQTDNQRSQFQFQQLK